MPNEIIVGARPSSKQFVGATEVQINQDTNVILGYTPSAPVVTGDDQANILSAFHTLGNSEIVYSEGNSSTFVQYTGPISVGNVLRAAGYWKFKIKAGVNRNESAVSESPAFNASLVTPDPPTVVTDDINNIVTASHPYGISEILVNGNNTFWVPYTGPISVGNVSQPAGYWKFKIKAAPGRNESAIALSNAFTASVTPVTPAAPTVVGDDVANLLQASHVLGVSEIVVSENNGPFVAYVGTITVGEVARPAGYWRFKIKAGTNRNESEIANSPVFTVTVTTAAAPMVVGDDQANTLTASSPLGASEILVSENGGPWTAYAGTIQVGDVARASGYWKFKVRAAVNRNESTVVNSPIFTISSPGSYSLIYPARVSAGVYKTDGTLVRTLFSVKSQPAGIYPIKWDGTDDFQNQVAIGNYDVKVAINSVEYTPEGTIGNTSRDKAGITIHKSLEPVYNILIIGNVAYYAVGYNEKDPALFSFNLATPQVKNNPWPDIVNQVTNHCCTDGVNIYWTGWDSYAQTNSWVFATKVTDNSLVNFSSGVPYQVRYGKNYPSVIDKKNVSAKATGIAASSTYLFISYKDLGYVTVVNKSSGAFVRNITLDTPTSMEVDGNNIWITTGGNTLRLYPINSDGTLGSSSILISGFSSVVDVRINGGNLVVMDGGASQQVKFFNKSNGTAVGSAFGQAGGIYASPAVANDRFAFWKINENTKVKENRGGIAFAPDGSFWLADSANNRILHFDSSKNFIEVIIAQCKTYGCFVDPNNHSRLTANLQEFNVLYNQADIKNSWSHKYNWEGKFPQGGYGWMGGVRSITTLSNGRTYGFLGRDAGGIEIVEFDAAIGLRFTGVVPALSNYVQMKANGDLYAIEGTGFGENEIWKRQKLTGFTASANPIYAAAETVLTVFTTGDMMNANLSGAHVLPWEVTSSNVLVCYRGNAEKDSNNIIKEPVGCYHLAGRNATTGALIFQTLRATHKEYDGEFPIDAFDTGNGIQPRGQYPMEYFGSVGMALEKNIFTGFNGEGFQGGNEVNKWNHYNDKGLLLGQFGVTGIEFANDPIANFAFCGNAFSPALIKEGSDYFLFMNDENAHGGIFRFKITGLSSITEQTIPINSSFVRTPEVVPDGVDLMAGLTFNASLPGASNGWSRIPSTDVAGFTARTNALVYDKRKPVDIYVEHKGSNASDYGIYRSLGSNSNLNYWTIKGQITFDNCMPDFTDAAGLNQYLDILDNTGKIIVRFYQTVQFNPSPNPASSTIWANNSVILSGDGSALRYLTSKLRDLVITKSGASIAVSFNGGAAVNLTTPFEPGAAFGNPTTLKLTFKNTGTGNMYPKTMGVTNFVFLNS